MRKQQLALRAFGLAAVLGIGPVHAGDEPAGAPSAPGPKLGEARHDKGQLGKPGHRPDHLRPEAAAEPSARGADKRRGDDKDEGAEKGKEPEGRGPGRHAMRDIWMELKSGKLKKGDVKERLSDLRDHRAERAQTHREALRARFGTALAAPAARQELEHHARRMAKLNRAMIVAETEVSKDKDKLKERIVKLMEKEQARHQRAMDRFQSRAPGAAASASASASAAPKAQPAVVAADKGDEK